MLGGCVKAVRTSGGMEKSKKSVGDCLRKDEVRPRWYDTKDPIDPAPSTWIRIEGERLEGWWQCICAEE